MYASIIRDLPKITDKTKMNYNYKAEKCAKLGIDILGKEHDAVQKISSLDGVKKNSILDYINVCIVLRRALGLTHKALVTYRDELRREAENEISEVNAELLKESLPSIKDLVAYTDGLYRTEDYQAFIINYLILNLNCRVCDIDAIIARQQLGTELNYLVIAKDKVTLVRNKYKTKEFYGAKVNELRDDKLIDSCNKMLGGRDSVALLSTNNGAHTSNPSMFIRSKLYNKMSPTKYFKIAVLETDKNDLIKLETNRGTAVKTILKSYNVRQNF